MARLAWLARLALLVVLVVLRCFTAQLPEGPCIVTIHNLLNVERQQPKQVIHVRPYLMSLEAHTLDLTC